MEFDFDKCREVLHRGLIDALTANADAIRLLARNETAGINAMSYDLLPWHRFVGISFRLSSDVSPVSGNGRYTPANWKHYEFIGDGTLDTVREYTGDAYALSGTRGQEYLHVILLAAAHALLDEQIAGLLQEYGIDACVRRDEIPWGGFEYLVLDDDKAFKANYCEFILANRVAKRLLGRIV
jgi:hypothetical protein